MNRFVLELTKFRLRWSTKSINVGVLTISLFGWSYFKFFKQEKMYCWTSELSYHYRRWRKCKMKMHFFFFEWFWRLLLVSLFGCYCHLNFLLEDYTFIHTYIYIYIYICMYVCVCICVCVYQLISKMLFSIRVSSILFILKMYNRSEYMIVVKHDHLKKWYLNKIE